MSNAPSKPVSFSRPKVGYFSNRPRIDGKSAAYGHLGALDCTNARPRTHKQTKLASINERYYKAPEEFSCSEVIDRASDCHSPSARIGEGSQNTSLWCW